MPTWNSQRYPTGRQHSPSSGPNEFRITMHSASPLRTCLAILLSIFLLPHSSRASITTRPADHTRLALSSQEKTQGFRNGFVIAKPHAGMHEEQLLAIELAEGMRLKRQFGRIGGYRELVLPVGENVDSALKRLRSTGRYESVEPDYVRRIAITPNDPSFGQQWALSNEGTSNGKAGADIKAASAWDVVNSAPNVVVAVIDTGARLSHPDLAPNLWRNTREVAGNQRDDDGNGIVDDVHGINTTTDSYLLQGTPVDDEGHGTHVAGIIGAVGNNGIGISGVAWKVQIMPLKALDADGYGLTSDFAACIDYAMGMGAHIINGSYGALSTSGRYSQIEYAAMKRCRESGVIFVAAAGNESSNMDVRRFYPACYPLDNIVAVGGTNRRDEYDTYSNYGTGSCELFAPGSDILSLNWQADSGTNAYRVATGTSMAAPFVAGSLALVKARFPNDTYRQSINRLLKTADPLPSLAGKAMTGGRLNLAAALSLDPADNRPFHDAFASRAKIVGSNVIFRSYAAGAQSEPGEPNHANQPAHASLWWEWVAPASTSVTIDTFGSDGDTVMAVYTGDTLASLVPVVSNDDTDGLLSRVSFNCTAGTVYKIAVDQKNLTPGLVMLNLSAVPGNDDFAKATVLTGASVEKSGSLYGASVEPGEPRILERKGSRSLWYKWVAPQSGPCQVSVISPDFTPLLAVYTGSTLPSLSLVTASTSSSTWGYYSSSLCSFSATANTTYWFTVDTRDSQIIGDFTLTVLDALWQFPTEDILSGSPAVAPDGTVYIGGEDYYLYAIQPDGALKWRYTLGGAHASASPTIAEDGTIYVGATNGVLYAVKSDGTRRWSYRTGSSLYMSPALTQTGTICFKSSDGYLYALEPEAGSLLWRTKITNVDDSYASPTISSDGTIYIGSSDKRLYALQSSDGSQRWHFEADDGIYTSVALDAEGNLYFATIGGTVYSLTPTGDLRWQRKMDGAISSSPAIGTNGLLVFGGYDKKVHALRLADGSPAWHFVTGDEIRASSPAIDANGVAYIGCYDNKLYAIKPDGTLSRSWSFGGWLRSSPVIAGQRLYVGSYAQNLVAISLSSGQASSPWPMRSYNPRRTGRAAPEKFAIIGQPRTQLALLDRELTLTVVATGPSLQFQWKRDGAIIPGATNSTLNVRSTTASTAGSYTVVVSSPSGSLTSEPAVITVAAAQPGRLSNLSVRAVAGAGDKTLIVGFILIDGTSKPLLVRAIGPTLAKFGLTDVLPNPTVRVFDGTTKVAENLDWGGSTGLRDAFARLGAFSLDPASQDAALITSLAPKSYSVHITDNDTGSGMALAELYDTETLPTPGQAGGEIGRLTNLSARATVGTDAKILVAGFVIDGNVPKRLLIRAVGPSLQRFGVTGVLFDTRLELYRGNDLVAKNDDWNGASEISLATQSVQAFPFNDTASYDSAMVIMLEPGNYTAQVRGYGTSTGVALVEIYELPQEK